MSGHDVSALGLFLSADPVVKAVMTLLLLASVACWAIILDKGVALTRASRQAERFAAAVRAGEPAEGWTAAGGVTAAILAAARREAQDDDETESRAERRDRHDRAMRLALAVEMKRLEGGLAFLATVGSAGPFVGLFGTVWGIMHSFTAIAGTADTSLAVVAPGIAEALFATAIGLFAAIPAVVAYNKLATGLGRLSFRLGTVVAELATAAGRDRRPWPPALRVAE